DTDRHYERIASYVHEVGTARMGIAPEHSVVDPLNRVWDAPNVLVLDGACWPTNPCPNPTLTMLAVASRACESMR
ncbi:MAG: GMC oxidoreductase, partial [Actinomycetota bacterium]